MKKKNKEVLLVIFNLYKREKYTQRFLKLISAYRTENFLTILIINEKNKKRLNIKNKNIKVLQSCSKKKIFGMNQIFVEILNQKKIINKFKYICFVEDDNFIFPNSLNKFRYFLKKNSEYIACSGDAFLFREYKEKFLIENPYPLINNLIEKKTDKRFLSYNGGLSYYSLIRTKYLLKILEKIKLIKDHNLSEVYFNYFLIKQGKIRKLNYLYLAREYPRPQVYNITSKLEWLKNKNLLKELNIITNDISKGYSKEILDISIFKYLSVRFLKKKKNINHKILDFFKKYFFYIKYMFLINYFFNKINKI